ncbi:hypothetical protein HY991_02005 [Candidatus Micrarchaeota archaeon]|nr:hypothetical protein [Candidatus Micrarchaeota archaeon]
MRLEAWQVIALLVIPSVIAYVGFDDFKKAQGEGLQWVNPLVIPEEVQAIQWIKNHSSENDVILSDIYGTETVMSLTNRRGVIGGDWSISNNSVTRMRNATDFFKTNDSLEAYKIARRYGVRYALVVERQMHAGFEWLTPNNKKFEDKQYFTKAFDAGKAKVYEIKYPYAG